jgi:hypothetical protein
VPKVTNEETERIRTNIQAFFEKVIHPYHRYRSWEHCFRYFHESTRDAVAADRHHAALQLGFYLASWGMYRGSSFLLQHDYTIHLEVVDQLLAHQYSVLWEQEFGADENDTKLVPIILQASNAIRVAYAPFSPRGASDKLITKILLGTFGCLPACDTYFVAGFRSVGYHYSNLNRNFIDSVLRFSINYRDALRDEQRIIKRTSGVYYPLMKLIDMYFWQIGLENAGDLGDG